MAIPTGETRIKRMQENFELNAKNLRRWAEEQVAMMASGNISSNQILAIYQDLHAMIDAGAALAAVPDINTRMQTDYNDVTLDWTSEVTSFTSAAQAVITEIESLIPTDSDGFIQTVKIISGQVSTRGFNETETANLQTLLAAVGATID